jgi:hypothetical protein
VIVYPDFQPSAELRAANSTTPSGHLLFSAEGIPIWRNDVLAFLKEHLAVKPA